MRIFPRRQIRFSSDGHCHPPLRQVRCAAITVLAALATLALPLADETAAKSTPARRPNIVLITVESLRADRLGCYTNGRIKSTPQIDALAARGSRFERAYAASPSTVPSTASLLTGVMPSRHGLVHDLGGRLSDKVTTLAERLMDTGYRTGAVVGSFHLDSDRGLSRGFAFYDDEFEGIRKREALFSKERRADESVTIGLQFIDDGSPQRPFFLWLDFYDPHLDHEPPKPLGERFAADPYQGEIAHVDAQVGTLLTGLKKRGLTGSTLIVLAASHGEGLGDHDEVGHGIYVYETTVRVPFIVVLPGSRAGRVVSDVVGLIDVTPTVLDFVSIRTGKDISGRSLLSMLGEGKAVQESESDRPYTPYTIEAWQPWAAYGWSPLFAVIDDEHKVIRGARREAFDLKADPEERAPLDPQPGWSRGLASLAPRPPEPPDPFPTPERTRRWINDRVVELAPPWDNSPICIEKMNWPDPRDRTAINEELFRARLASDQGAPGTAASLSRTILEKDPANFTALELVIFLMLRNPGDDMILEPLGLLQCNYPFRGTPYHLIGHYLEQRDPERAGIAIEIYRELEPWDEVAEYHLAIHRAARGDIDAALSHLERAIALGAEDLDFIRRDPRLAPLRQNPRFAELLGPVGR